MDYEARQIEVIFDSDGSSRLGDRGYPHVALVDPDIPARFNELAKYIDAGHTMMRVTVGNMWAIYRLKGVTLAGHQIWALQATRCTLSKHVRFINRFNPAYDGSEEGKQIKSWLLED